MRRVANATVLPAMAARHDLAIAMPSSATVSLLAGALLRASVVVSSVSSIINGLLLLITHPAVNLVEGVAGLAKLDTDTTREGQEER